MINKKIRFLNTNTASTFFVALIVVGMILFTGCRGDDVTGPESFEIVDIAITPDSVSFDAGEQQEFSVLALTDAGDTIELKNTDIEWEGGWWSSDTDVFTVENNGLATGKNPGEAFCIVEVTLGEDRNMSKMKTTSAFVGRDSAFVMVF
jgi:hypothetical protein